MRGVSVTDSARDSTDRDRDPAESVRNHADSDRNPAASDRNPAASARNHVLESNAETVEAVLECADSVAEEWDGEAATGRDAVADSLRAQLEAEEVWSQLPDVLAGAVRAAGGSLSATPVAAPPYVVATSRGPMLRATLDGGRLVVLFHVFDVADGDEAAIRYTRGATTPAEAVRAKFK
ncbi:hypothetical protein [Halorussus ruber]|uniref:hypothetical protein n=1 Tax=Halorussus ruber TaxID=1126238 RepID=UPI00143CD3FC|nr:hypothetical protein [Halorussus ruber]